MDLAIPGTATAPQRLGHVVVIAASAGGLSALTTVVGMLPATLRAPVVVVQHLHPDHRSQLAEILERRCDLPVEQAVAGAALREGTIIVAAPGHHLVLTSAGTVELTRSPAIRFVRPSADVTLASMADVYGARAVAVVLTGTGADGADGTLAVHRAGGTVVVQDPDTAEFSGMPRAVIDRGWADRQVVLEDIAGVLVGLVGSGT